MLQEDHLWGMLCYAVGMNLAAFQLPEKPLAVVWKGLPMPPIYAPFRTLLNFMFIQRSYLSWTVIGIALVVLVIGIAAYALTRRQAWQTAAYIDQNLQPGDAIAISYGNFPRDAFNIRDSFSWYYPAMSSECYVDVRIDANALEQQISDCGIQNDRLWLVVYTSNPEGERLTLQNVPERYRLIESQDFVGTSIYLFNLES